MSSTEAKDNGGISTAPNNATGGAEVSSVVPDAATETEKGLASESVRSHYLIPCLEVEIKSNLANKPSTDSTSHPSSFSGEGGSNRKQHSREWATVNREGRSNRRLEE